MIRSNNYGTLFHVQGTSQYIFHHNKIFPYKSSKMSKKLLRLKTYLFNVIPLCKLT